MKLFITSSFLIASTVAFAPVNSPQVLSALRAVDVAEEAPGSVKKETPAKSVLDFSKELGAQAPLGFWDPTNFVYDVSQEYFDDFRLKELTHGRVAMLAFTGYVTTLAGYRIPGCEDVPAGWAALSNVPGDVGILSILTLALLVISMNSYSEVYPEVAEPEFPGDFRNGAIDFGWDKMGEKKKLQKRAIELNNGRAAMMGWLGLVVHEKMGNLDDLIPGLSPSVFVGATSSAPVHVASIAEKVQEMM